MKKTCLRYSFLFFLFFFLFAGCTTKKEEAPSLSKEDQALTWRGPKKKNFGNYDYKNMTSKKEAENLLKKKFQVDVSSFYLKTLDAMKEASFLATYKEQSSTYNVIGQEQRLTYQSIYQYGHDKQVQMKVIVTLLYEWDQDKQEAILRDQSVLYQGDDTQASVLYEALPKFGETYGTILGASSMPKEVKAYQTRYKAQEKDLTQQPVQIFSKKIAQQLTKEFQVFYNNDGYLSECYIRLGDLRQ